VEAFALKEKQKAKSLDSRQEHAGMTSKGESWMTSPTAVESPASAGMTS
jgi:hypothetical protein